MRVLSLFDGIATGRLALEMAGVPVDLYIASEIDKDAKAVARANWPDMIHIGPVESVTAPDLPKIDLVIGGSPCQGFSRAGAGLNFDDPRSRLFFDYVRVLNEVREKNPDVKFLLENVIMKREWEDVITEKLGVQPVHINSRAHSAQNRPRAYWSTTRRGRVIHQKSHTITCACDICVFYDNIIRHFTVEELEKLQGLPAGYTAAVPEPARKRAIGNGWTASVIAEIFKLLPQAETAVKTDVA